MQITIAATPQELEEMGLTAPELSNAVLSRLDQEGVNHNGRDLSLSGFDVTTDIVAPQYPDATDVDSLRVFLTKARSDHGNMPLMHSPSGSVGQLLKVTVGVARMGAGPGPKRLVSRGGAPVLVVF